MAIYCHFIKIKRQNVFTCGFICFLTLSIQTICLQKTANTLKLKPLCYLLTHMLYKFSARIKLKLLPEKSDTFEICITFVWLFRIKMQREKFALWDLLKTCAIHYAFTWQSNGNHFDNFRGQSRKFNGHLTIFKNGQKIFNFYFCRSYKDMKPSDLS